MKYSIFMQWKQKQTILIYIILLQLKELFDKQNATFNIHLLCPNKHSSSVIEGTVFVTIRLGVYINNFLVVLCLSPKPSIMDFW